MKKSQKRTELEDTLLFQIRVLNLPEPEREYKFHPKRRWRLDLAWDKYKIGAEVQGGTWSGGRHVRSYGYRNDREKINEALLLGWKVFEFTSDMVKNGEAINCLEKALNERKNNA